MNPNATLERIRRAVSAVDKAKRLAPHAVEACALDAAYAMRDLDEWLSSGGTLPDAWKPKPTEVVDAELEDEP